MVGKVYKVLNQKLTDCKEGLLIKMARKKEVKKFEDPKRVEIYDKIDLTQDQIKAIDDLYLQNYGEKIPYIWHRHFTAFTGKFDVNYIPELIYIPEFERFMNVNRDYTTVFSDKNILPFLAGTVGIKTPKVYVSATNGIYRDEHFRFICKEAVEKILWDIGEIFAKPSVDSDSGRGCFVFNIKSGHDIISGNSVDEILGTLGNNFVIQERLKCHASIAKIYSGSVNTFRVITYRWREKIHRMPVIMRIGQGGKFLDNAHAGGMFIAVDDDGALHSTAFTEFRKSFTEHPDSHLRFDGHKIELFDKVIESATKMHEAIPQIGVVNWDFTINEEGEPVLIEANMNGGSIWLIEMAHGRGVFGDNTKEVLAWMKMMKELPPHERKKFAFGKNKA